MHFTCPETNESVNGTMPAWITHHGARDSSRMDDGHNEDGTLTTRTIIIGVRGYMKLLTEFCRMIEAKSVTQGTTMRNSPAKQPARVPLRAGSRGLKLAKYVM
jgi:hypothetical protein